MAEDNNDAVVSDLKEQIAKLTAKNQEIIGELRAARKNSTIDPDEFNKIKDERDSLSEKLNEASKATKQAIADLDKIKKDHEKEAAFVSKLLIENGLNDALTSAGIKNPILIKAAKAMLSSQAQIKIDGENRLAVIGDKPLSDFIGEWSKTDEGKYFVDAPNSSGGGAPGGSTNAGGADLSKLSPVDRINAARAAASN